MHFSMIESRKLPCSLNLPGLLGFRIFWACEFKAIVNSQSRHVLSEGDLRLERLTISFKDPSSLEDIEMDKKSWEE